MQRSDQLLVHGQEGLGSVVGHKVGRHQSCQDWVVQQELQQQRRLAGGPRHKLLQWGNTANMGYSQRLHVLFPCEFGANADKAAKISSSLRQKYFYISICKNLLLISSSFHQQNYSYHSINVWYQGTKQTGTQVMT